MASLYVDLRKSTTHRRHCSSSAFVLSSRVHRQPATVVRCSILGQPPAAERRSAWNNRTRCPDSTPSTLLFPSNLTYPSSFPPPFFLPFIRPSACLPACLPACLSVRSSVLPSFLRSFHRLRRHDVARQEKEREPGVTHRLWILMTRAMNSDRAKGGSSAVNPLCFSVPLSFSYSTSAVSLLRSSSSSSSTFFSPLVTISLLAAAFQSTSVCFSPDPSITFSFLPSQRGMNAVEPKRILRTIYIRLFHLLDKESRSSRAITD